jgi:NAD+ diphosphatase
MFSFSEIDRQSQLRADTLAITRFWESDQSRTLLWQDGHFLMQDGKPRYFSFHQLQDFKSGLDEAVYLGQYQGCEYFAAQIKQAGIDFAESEMMSLRRASTVVSALDAEMMVYAQGILNWLRNHAFCSRCGSDTSIIEAGHGRRCNNTQCTRVSYPKIDPAVIFSIVNNTGPESKILLGRKSIWDENRYSVIAGFVEPGETLEDAVRREAYEETGVKVNTVEYIRSQPWPFPDSLMLGFSAQTSDQQITRIDQELEKASWFTANEIEAGVKTQSFKPPFKISIAWHLIDRWFISQKGYSLGLVNTY